MRRVESEVFIRSEDIPTTVINTVVTILFSIRFKIHDQWVEQLICNKLIFFANLSKVADNVFTSLNRNDTNIMIDLSLSSHKFANLYGCILNYKWVTVKSEVVFALMALGYDFIQFDH